MKLIRTGILLALMIIAVESAAQKPRKAAEFRMVLDQVQFTAEKSNIRPEAAWELDQVAALLKKSPAATAEVGAHTDASGSARYNLRLSQQRAQAVAAYLTKKGIASKRLRAVGYGETKPLNRCKRGIRCSEAEKRQNRRVELRVSGLVEGSEVYLAWMAFSGTEMPKTAPVQVAKQPETVQQALERRTPEAAKGPAPPERTDAGADFFPELNDARQHVPQPLPGTFAGYTIEIACADRPLAAGHPTLRKYDPVFLRRDANGQYCYYIGVFHTLPDANQFLRTTALPLFSNARVTAFLSGEKKYYPAQNR